MVAEERITTKFAGPRHGPRQRGGGDLPRHPAGRRGAPHAVLRALPGRGDRRPRGDRRRTSRAPASSSPPPSRRLRRSARRRRTSGWSPTRPTRRRRSPSSPPTTWSSRARSGLRRSSSSPATSSAKALLPGFVDGLRKIHHDEQRHIGYGTWYLRDAVARGPALGEESARRCASCCRPSPIAHAARPRGHRLGRARRERRGDPRLRPSGLTRRLNSSASR